MDRQEISTPELPRAVDIFEFPEDGMRVVTWPEIQRLAESLADIEDQVAAEMTRVQVWQGRPAKRRLIRTRRKPKPKHRRQVGTGSGLKVAS